MQDLDTQNSTIFYTNDDDEEELTPESSTTSPQQSFIFGADQFQSTSRAATDQTNDGGREEILEMSLNNAAWAKTNWSLVLRHWLLSMLFLPLYVFAVVTHAWKTDPRSLTRLRGTVIILSSLLFYALLWTMISLMIAFPSVKRIFPPQGALFVLFLYFMCCFAEGMIKNTHMPTTTTTGAQRADASTLYPTAQTNGQEGLNQGGEGQEYYTGQSGKAVSIQSFLETAFSVAAPLPSSRTVVVISTAVTTFLYTGLVFALHMYSISAALSLNNGPVVEDRNEGALMAYSVVVTLVQSGLCFVILFPIAQVALRLYTRSTIAKLFFAATSPDAKGAYSFSLTSIQNVHAWQTIRDNLLRLYAFPTLYVDVVLSTAFTLWVPLVIIGALDFLFRAGITALTLNATTLAVLILAYLLVCVVLAAQVQETLSNTDALRMQEYQFIIRQRNIDPEKEEEARRLSVVLKRLADLIDKVRDNAIVFKIWGGFALNRRMATVLGGVLVTLSSSILVRAAAKVASF